MNAADRSHPPTPAGRAPHGQVTVKEVAQLAGVSFKTVSRVTNNEPHVATETRARVEHAIIVLGYKRNEGAAELRRGWRRST